VQKIIINHQLLSLSLAQNFDSHNILPGYKVSLFVTISQATSDNALHPKIHPLPEEDRRIQDVELTEFQTRRGNLN
jgi:hypothetical protein